jgi:hypothetical protein
MLAASSRRRGIRLAGPAMLLFAVGCTAWRQEPGGVMAVLERQPRKIRITTADSSRAVVSGPALDRDTIVGRSSGAPARIPTDAIVRVETRRFDGASTAGVLGGMGVLAVIGVIAAQSAVESALGR